MERSNGGYAIAAPPLWFHCCGSTVAVSPLRFHRCLDSVWARLVQGRSMSSALTKAMKRCLDPGPAAFLQHIRERGVQWGGVMGAMLLLHYRYGSTVVVPLLRFHRFPDSVRMRLVQGRSMSSALTKAMKRCFGPAASSQCILERGCAVGRSNGAMLLLHHRYGSSVAASPFP